MRTGTVRQNRQKPLFAATGFAALLVVAPLPASAQTPALPPADRVIATAPAAETPLEPRVVGMRTFPGARNIATMSLTQPGIRERVAALTARFGGRVAVTTLEAGIYQLPGAVSQDQVIAFYNRELSEEMKAREGGRGVLKLRRQPNGRSRLVDCKRFFAHHGLTLETARGLAVEEFGGGVVGFRLPEEGAGEAEAPAQVTKGGRRKAAAG